MENAAGAEVAAANQRVWLYAEDGVTLIKAATTNANGWVDFGAQPEHFAIAYEVGKQLVYQGIGQNPGEIKIVTPFNETVELDENGNCQDQSVKKTILISGIAEDTDFTARTNHPEWVTKLGSDGKTLTICAARAPTDGKFDLWLVSSAGYQHQAGINWQGAANLTFSPAAPALNSWTLTPGTSGLVTSTILISDSKQLAVFDLSLDRVEMPTTVQLALPRITATDLTMKVLAADNSGMMFTLTQPLSSLSTIPSVSIPAPSFHSLKWNATNGLVTWTTNPSSEVDFFELGVQLDDGNTTLVTLVAKGQSSFKMPQLPNGFSAKEASNWVDLSSVDYKDYSNVEGWQDATQSPLITLEEFIAKLHSAERNVTRTTQLGTSW